ncbi:MAG TPA: hypothetical protein VIU40_08405, partial [Geobacteraceae bacterium]
MPSVQELLELMASRLVGSDDEWEITPAPVEKHLAGHHDQRTHGYRAAASEFAASKALTEKYAGQPRDRRGRFAGGSTHPA